MKIHKISSETSYLAHPVAPRLGAAGIELLKENYLSSPRRRHRICFHQNPSVDLHDIVICYDSMSYIPPNKHIGKVESLLVLAGELDFFLFNESGEVYDYRRLGTAASGSAFYVRVPPNTWHGLRAKGPEPCVIKETISGPYDPLSLAWANFAPSEQDGQAKGFAWYDDVLSAFNARTAQDESDEVFLQVSDNLFKSARQLVTVNRQQLEPVVRAAIASPLKRARLCCHSGNEEKLQEMFIVLANGVDIEESFHIRKDESLTMIEGKGEYLFHNEDGSLRDSARLSGSADADKDSNFFVRINRYVPHKIEVTDDFILIHEATSGPFIKADTDYRLRSLIV